MSLVMGQSSSLKRFVFAALITLLGCKTPEPSWLKEQVESRKATVGVFMNWRGPFGSAGHSGVMLMPLEIGFLAQASDKDILARMFQELGSETVNSRMEIKTVVETDRIYASHWKTAVIKLRDEHRKFNLYNKMAFYMDMRRFKGPSDYTLSFYILPPQKVNKKIKITNDHFCLFSSNCTQKAYGILRQVYDDLPDLKPKRPATSMKQIRKTYGAGAKVVASRTSLPEFIDSLGLSHSGCALIKK